MIRPGWVSYEERSWGNVLEGELPVMGFVDASSGWGYNVEQSLGE